MHETKDLNVRGVVIFAAALLVVGLLIHAGIAVLFGAYKRETDRADRPPHPLARTSAAPPAPALEVAPRAALEALRREEDALLHSYGWVDRARGRVRIPIARAMDLIEQRGLPVRPAPPPAD
jgi:hypothetical protein